MLHALLHGKLGERTLTEDALSAIVFGRLSYLPDELAWEILLRAARPADQAKPDPEWAERLFGIPGPGTEDHFAPQLWVSLSPGPADREDRDRVEPDILLRRGDAWIVVEAKAPRKGGGQTKGQLGREYRALQHREKHERIGLLLVEPPEEYRAWMENMEPPMRMVRWSDLADVIQSLRDDRVLPPPQDRILADLLAALDIAEVTSLLPMNGLGRGLPPCRPLPTGRTS